MPSGAGRASDSPDGTKGRRGRQVSSSIREWSPKIWEEGPACRKVSPPYIAPPPAGGCSHLHPETGRISMHSCPLHTRQVPSTCLMGAPTAPPHLQSERAPKRSPSLHSPHLLSFWAPELCLQYAAARRVIQPQKPARAFHGAWHRGREMWPRNSRASFGVWVHELQVS